MSKRQDKLTKENQKCPHGFYFGSTCFDCRDDQIKAYLRGEVSKLNQALATSRARVAELERVRNADIVKLIDMLARAVDRLAQAQQVMVSSLGAATDILKIVTKRKPLAGPDPAMEDARRAYGDDLARGSREGE